MANDLVPTGKDIFHFDEKKENFETYGHENDILYWYASDLAVMLGYDNMKTFRTGPVGRAMTACNALDIPLDDSFIPAERIIDGEKVKDYKLSRFACYMVAMNGDVKKPQVAKAQAYFAALAEGFQKYFQAAESIERVIVRDEISDGEKTLVSTAKKAGVEHYAFFQNAGYRGMYNMNLSVLRIKKGVPNNRSPFDFMGKTELAANLFRVTQTEQRIKMTGAEGQKHLEKVAHDVGKKVRETMMQLSGTRPEELAPARDIREVHKELKSTNRGFKKLDSGKKKKKAG